MSAKSESLQGIKARSAARHAKAALKVTPGEPVELHWPDSSVETVIVRLVEQHTARVERAEAPNVFANDTITDVPKRWLRPIKNP